MKFAEGENVLINTTIRGHFKDYLKQSKGKNFFRFYPVTKDDTYYEQILPLRDKPDDVRKEIIKEWEYVKDMFIKEILSDGTKWHESDDFAQFRLSRLKSYNPKTKEYIRLNKKKDEISYTHFIKRQGMVGYKQDRVVISLENIEKIRKTILVFSEENKDLCRDFHETFLCRTNQMLFCIVGERDLKKLIDLNLKNVKMFAEHKIKDVKIFNRLGTAILFSQLIKKYENIIYSSKEFISRSFSTLEKDVEVLKKYVASFKDIPETKISLLIIDKIKEDKSYDLTHWEEFKRVEKACEELSFLQFFVRPSSASLISQEEFDKFINKQLIFNKLHHKYDLDNFAIKLKL